MGWGAVGERPPSTASKLLEHICPHGQDVPRGDPQVPQAKPLALPGFLGTGDEEGAQGALGSYALSQGGSTGASSQGGSPAVSTCLVSPSPSRFCGWWTELLRASELCPPPLLPIWLGIQAFLFSLESQGPVSIPREGVPSSAREREGRGGSSWRRRAGPEAKPERKALPANEG